MRKTRKGGSYGPMPLKYFDGSLTGPSAGAGHDLLRASGMGIRPRIGGTRRSKHSMRHNKRGGFVPSVMGNFVQSTSKYIVPMALYAGYKLMTRKGLRHAKKSKKTRRH